MFRLINYQTNESYLCSWNPETKEHHSQQVHYIGITEGLGGYNYMISKGFIDRRFSRYIYSNRVLEYKWNKQLEEFKKKFKLELEK
jgi:hypothetical protein